MLLKTIGEFGLIKRFQKQIKTDASVVKGSGDDCAVLKFGKDQYQLFTCDMIVEGVDFCLKDNLYLVGRKALAISISDIAACGGIPRHAVVSLGLPKSISVEKIDRISKGLFDLSKKYKINIVGGDISRARQLTIDVSMLGLVKRSHLVLRNKAKKGDIVFVSGPLGGSIKGKHLKFTPRLKESQYLVNNFKINSMIDISDGLIQDLGHILKQSNCGAVVYEQLVPKNSEAKNLNDALYSGEDFELLFTLSLKQARKLIRENLFNFKPIGEITDKKLGFKLIDHKGRKKSPQQKGFKHF